jgi:hypothetical protein
MTVRSELSDALRPLLPDTMRIIDVPRSLDGLEANRPVVLLYRDRLQKAPNAQGAYLSTVSLWIITPNIDTVRAEDALDTALEHVIFALDQILWANWTTAERSIFGDAQAPAYRIDLSVATTKE